MRVEQVDFVAIPTRDVPRAAMGVEFKGETVDSGVCHMAFCSDPDGNTIIIHRRYAD